MRVGHGSDAIFFAFAVADGDGFIFEVDVFDAEADAFHQSQAGAVEKLAMSLCAPLSWLMMLMVSWRVRTVGRRSGRLARSKEDGFDFLLEDFAVEEEDGAEGLILCGCGDVAFSGEVGEEGADFGCAHLGVLFAMEEDVAANPVDVGFFGAVGVVFGAEGVGELVEQFFCHRN